MLSRVTSLHGDATTLTWSRNASGRPFLAAVRWGGRPDGTQYRPASSYDLLAAAFDSRAAAPRLVLDRRVSQISLDVTVVGTYQPRARYDLSYLASPSGPAFYLHELVKTYASGAAEPPIRYDYDRNAERLAA